MKHGWLWANWAVVMTAWAGSAHAESSAYCSGADILEVFPGATGCEDAHYVVLSLHQSDWVQIQFELWDACRENPEWLTYEGVPFDAGANRTLLVATRKAAEVFGIEPDLVLEDSPLSRAGGLVSTCWDLVRFGEGRSIPSPTDGQALAWTGSRWESREARPLNSEGRVGTLTGCGPRDGGTPAPVEPLVCEEPEPIPDNDPDRPEAGVSVEPENAPDPPEPGSSVEPEPTTPTPPVVPNPNRPAPVEVPATPDLGDGGLSASRSDAGPPPSNGNETEAPLNSVADSSTTGCDCRVGAPLHSSPAAAWGALLFAFGFARRSGRHRSEHG
jgi:hypothetical protein